MISCMGFWAGDFWAGDFWAGVFWADKANENRSRDSSATAWLLIFDCSLGFHANMIAPERQRSYLVLLAWCGGTPSAREPESRGFHAGRYPAADHGLLRRSAGCAGKLRNLRASRHVVRRLLQRRPYSGDCAGDLRVPRGARRRWAALSGEGYARALGAGIRHGAGGPGGKWDRDHDRPGPGLYAHARAFACPAHPPSGTPDE